jgi:hypothetical protein
MMEYVASRASPCGVKQQVYVSSIIHMVCSRSRPYLILINSLPCSEFRSDQVLKR